MSYLALVLRQFSVGFILDAQIFLSTPDIIAIDENSWGSYVSTSRRIDLACKGVVLQDHESNDRLSYSDAVVKRWLLDADFN